ncbi:hypothetical protein ACS0TY_016939 [Phlomoides rotata]
MLNTEGTQGFQEWQVYYFVRTSNPINGEGDEEANDRYFVTSMQQRADVIIDNNFKCALKQKVEAKKRRKFYARDGQENFQEEDKARLVQETGLQLKQINNWFINQRKRNWHNNPSSSSIVSKNKCKRSNAGNR